MLVRGFSAAQTYKQKVKPAIETQKDQNQLRTTTVRLEGVTPQEITTLLTYIGKKGFRVSNLTEGSNNPKSLKAGTNWRGDWSITIYPA